MSEHFNLSMVIKTAVLSDQLKPKPLNPKPQGVYSVRGVIPGLDPTSIGIPFLNPKAFRTPSMGEAFLEVRGLGKSAYNM